MALVALAGPGTNLVLAAVSALALRGILHSLAGVTEDTATPFITGVVVPLAQMANGAVTVNVSLAVFNLLPLPPLDGGRVLTGILPYAQARLVAAIEPFGFLILMGLIMTGWLSHIVNGPIMFLRRVLL